MPPRPRAQTSSSFNFSSLFKQQQPHNQQRNRDQPQNVQPHPVIPTLEQVLGALREQATPKLAAHLLQHLEDGQQLSYEDFGCVIGKLLDSQEREIGAVGLQIYAKYVLDHVASITSLQRRSLFRLLSSTTAWPGPRLEALKTLFLTRPHDLTGFEDMVIEHLKTSLESLLDMDEEDPTVIQNVWQSHAQCLEIILQRIADEAARENIQQLYARLITKLLVRNGDDAERRAYIAEVSADPLSSSSVGPRRVPTPPPTMTTKPYSSPPTRERHYHHIQPAVTRSVSASVPHSLLGHRRHPSSSSSQPNPSLSVSPVRMNSFAGGSTVPSSPASSMSYPIHQSFPGPSPLPTPGPGSIVSGFVFQTMAQIHLQAVTSIYLDSLLDPTRWDEHTLRRVLPVLFSVLGLWASDEPLPRIGVGKERSSANRAKSFGGKGPSRGAGKEPESDSEALKVRVENTISQCCQGVYEWVVLDVIKESSAPLPKEACSVGSVDEGSTPTPTIATFPITDDGERESPTPEREPSPGDDDKTPLDKLETSQSQTLYRSPPSHLLPLGALRTLHLQLRERLRSQLISSYVPNLGGEGAYTQSGGFAGIDDQDIELMRAYYAKKARPESSEASGSDEENENDELGGGPWDMGTCKGWLAGIVGEWVDVPEKSSAREREGVEVVLNEALSLLKDVVHVVHELAEYRTEGGEIPGDDLGLVVSEVLAKAVLYVRRVRNPDGTPYILPLDLPREAPSLLLQTISSLLDPQYLPIVTPVSTGFQSTSIPNLALIALSITPHLSDEHTARMPSDMDLLPVSSRWINDFKTLFQCLCSSLSPEDGAMPFDDRSDRELSRQAVFKRGVEIWGVIRDWGAYRIPLADLIFDFWQKVGGDAGESNPHVWKMLGQEYALRVMERIAQERQDDAVAAQETEMPSSQYEPEDILRHLTATTSSCQYHLQPQRFEPQTPASAGPTSPPLAPAGSNVSSAFVSPIISRVHSQQQVTPPGPSTASTPSLKASLLPRASDTSTDDFCPGCLAAIALVNVFSTLSFSPNPATANAQKVFTAILKVLSTSPCTRTRLLTLQYMMRLRADRNHRIYLIGNIDAEVEPLARTLGFTNENPETRPSGRHFSSQDAIGGRTVSGSVGASTGTSRSRPASRGGGRGLNTTSSSRSRSRASEPVHSGVPSATSIPLPRRALWSIPETLNFWLPGREVEDDLIFIQPSPSILTYEPSTDRPTEEGAGDEPRKESLTLLVSDYVAALTEILEHETEWDILSYVLSHLPLQLANKHFFCGPLCRESILRLQQVVCTTLGQGTLGNTVLDLPFYLHIRDAQSVGYHILTVLISYSPIFDPHRRDLIVRVLFGGIMAGIAPTITCCISALTLCAFELETQVARYLPKILEILERIMSNAAVAVHVLAFLGIVGSKPELYSNFTEDHFRQVFAIALKYLEAHNDPDANSDLPFGLTQHVLFMTFNVIYTWFLAVNLEDRPQFVRYITRQVLLASGNVLTEPAEVCFDWLARYTYSSVDPKPAPSLLRESVIPDDEATKEVFFLLGKSIVSIRAEGQKGWLEVTARRPSGMTRFLCHIQNHPLVPAGDPQPDLISLPAAALENRVPARMKMPRDRDPQAASETSTPKDDIEGEQAKEGGGAAAANNETYLEDDARQGNEEPAERPVEAVVESGSEGKNKGEGVEKNENDDGVEIETEEDIPQTPSKPGSDPLTDEVLGILTAAENQEPVTEAPDSLTGYVWAGTAPSQRRKGVTSHPGFFGMQLSPYPDDIEVMRTLNITKLKGLKKSIDAIDRVPVIDTHTVGVLYVAPGQKDANTILTNQHGSPAYTRFLQGLGRLVQIRGQQDVYTGGLDADIDGEYAIAWWDDIEQLVYHVATLMPNETAAGDDTILNKRAHVGNDHVKVVWNDGGLPYDFETIPGQFNSVNIIIEPHSLGTIAAYSDDGHENEYFKLTMQRQENMPDFGPIADFKIVSAVNLPLFVRRICFLADWFCKVYSATEVDKANPEFITNWRYRLQSIKRIKERSASLIPEPPATIADTYDFTRMY